MKTFLGNYLSGINNKLTLDPYPNRLIVDISCFHIDKWQSLADDIVDSMATGWVLVKWTVTEDGLFVAHLLDARTPEETLKFNNNYLYHVEIQQREDYAILFICNKHDIDFWRAFDVTKDGLQLHERWWSHYGKRRDFQPMKFPARNWQLMMDMADAVTNFENTRTFPPEFFLSSAQ